MSKPKIFLSVSYYLPGYRGGGPIQSIRNIVNGLSDEFDFYIFTSNHDFGVSEPYNSIITDKWNISFGAKIFYSSDKNKKKNLKKILKNKQFSMIFLNSFFSIDTIIIILNYQLMKLNTPILLMPRGELSEGALSMKATKKRFYIRIIKNMKLFKGIHYLATAKDEFSQINHILSTQNVELVSNIPNKEKCVSLNTKDKEELNVVFLSRITPKKNLDYALNTLKNCHKKISFDIYGTMEDIKYWEKCQEIISKLPSNIVVSYRGELANELVIKTLSNYDLFYLPTKSENYGHVISEALQASIPVLLSDTTPWIDLEEKGYGWIHSLSEPNNFSATIDEVATLKVTELNHYKKMIYANFEVEVRAKNIIKNYKKKLRELINIEE